MLLALDLGSESSMRSRLRALDAVQAVVAQREMRRLVPDDSPRSLTRATPLGAASSSCSYFFAHDQTFAKFWGLLIAPLIAILSLVCSIGNAPLAAVRQPSAQCR